MLRLLPLLVLFGCATSGTDPAVGDDDDDLAGEGEGEGVEGEAEGEGDLEGEGEAEEDAGSEHGGLPTCDDPPDGAVIDTSEFGPCCDGAHCVSNDLVPADQADQFSSCEEDTGVCVPDLFIETLGVFTLATCDSIGGVEGRCMSSCLPQVAEQAANLPQSTCAASERCLPCCDPMTGDETGVCNLGCDTGPAAACGAPAFPTCCDDDSGHCIPGEMIPDDEEGNLNACQDPAGSFCIPDVLQDPAFEGQDCLGEGLLDDYQGVCIPECLNIPFSFMLDAADCPPGYLCGPCENMLTGEPTGAPGCE